MDNTKPLIEDWLQAKRELVLAVEKERQLRDAVVGALFPDANRGTNKHVMDDGRVVKYVRGLNIKLTNPERDLAYLRSGLATGVIPEKLIKEKVVYEVHEPTYAGLSDDAKKFLSGALEVKDRAATLSVE